MAGRSVPPMNFIKALVHNTDILFPDEPTSGLDPTNSRLMKDIAMKLGRLICGDIHIQWKFGFYFVCFNSSPCLWCHGFIRRLET